MSFQLGKLFAKLYNVQPIASMPFDEIEKTPVY